MLHKRSKALQHYILLPTYAVYLRVPEESCVFHGFEMLLVIVWLMPFQENTIIKIMNIQVLKMALEVDVHTPGAIGSQKE